jgi:hypothetical protein
MTVKEQLVYEIGDPENYLSPDVTVSFASLEVEDLGHDRVRVSGATGEPRPETYKVSATLRDGFRSAGTLTIIGRNYVSKARRCGELVLQRVREAGFELRDCVVECLGSGDGAAGIIRPQTDEPGGFGETMLRIAVETDSRDAAERFSRELMPLITAGPQGTTGYAEGRPRVHPMFRYWPCLISRELVTPRVEILTTPGPAPATPSITSRAPSPEPPAPSPHSVVPASAGSDRLKAELRTANIRHPSHLYDIAAARSGDKGTSANIGVIARHDDSWDFLRAWLTADRVATFFSPLGIDSVQRFELPNLCALNFVLRGALRRSLRSDAQGKALGQVLLEMPLDEDAAHAIIAAKKS